MILEMTRLRLLGPRPRLDEVLGVLQDLGTLHLSPPIAGGPLVPVALDPHRARTLAHLRAALADADAALAGLGLPPAPAGRAVPPPTTGELAQWARRAARTRHEVERLAAAGAALAEERALILKYQPFFTAFRTLLDQKSRWPNATAYHVLLKRGEATNLGSLQGALRQVIGEEFQLYDHPLPSGETAVLVLVSAGAAAKVERLLAEARVQEIPVPEAFGGKSLTEAIPRMLARLDDLPAEEAKIAEARSALAREEGPELYRAQAGLHDRLQTLEAVPHTALTPRAFVIEGWVPTRSKPMLERGVHHRCGDEVVVTEVTREQWEGAEAPVELSNPRLLRPFELLIRAFPLPRYGSIDPTPFVAVFFPAFFGLMVGDIGYGLVLAVLGLVLHAKSRPGTLLRNVAEIAGPCALFSIMAGILFGELFGDLGTRWFGLEPILFRREEAIVPFLLLALALGVVHMTLGLVLGAISARRHPRQAAGRGISALMVLLVVAALLAAVRVLPERFFTPVVILLLVAFPVLIALEGVVAMIELVTTFGNILSYARIMALGVASVMLAVVANRMVGALGSVAVGVLFATLFHIVNFAIALFTPTIHALRLHYVEFFGKFYSPSGVRYAPLAHWTRATAPSSSSPSPARQAV